jgi:hypothetical protein
MAATTHLGRGLLACCAVLMPQPWRWRHHVSPKRWYTNTRLCGAITQKTTIFPHITVKTSNPTLSTQLIYRHALLPSKGSGNSITGSNGVVYISWWPSCFNENVTFMRYTQFSQTRLLFLLLRWGETIVFFAVRTEFLNIILTSFGFKGFYVMNKSTWGLCVMKLFTV